MSWVSRFEALHQAAAAQAGRPCRLWSWAGLALSTQAEAQMGNWARANADKSEVSHNYARVEVGKPILEAFGEYIARYGF